MSTSSRKYLVEAGTVQSSKVIQGKLHVEVTGAPSFTITVPLDGAELAFRGPAAGEKIYFAWGVER